MVVDKWETEEEGQEGEHLSSGGGSQDGNNQYPIHQDSCATTSHWGPANGVTSAATSIRNHPRRRMVEEEVRAHDRLRGEEMRDVDRCQRIGTAGETRQDPSRTGEGMERDRDRGATPPEGETPPDRDAHRHP